MRLPRFRSFICLWLTFDVFLIGGLAQPLKGNMVEAREKDPILEDAMTFLGIQSLAATLENSRFASGVRLIACSAWAVDVFTILELKSRNARFDGVPAESGYVLVLDRAHWGDGAMLFSSERSVRNLSQSRLDRFRKVVDAATPTKLKQSDARPGDPVLVDGGTTVIEWGSPKETKVFCYRTTAQEFVDLGNVVTEFYNLLKQE